MPFSLCGNGFMTPRRKRGINRMTYRLDKYGECATASWPGNCGRRRSPAFLIFPARRVVGNRVHKTDAVSVRVPHALELVRGGCSAPQERLRRFFETFQRLRVNPVLRPPFPPCQSGNGNFFALRQCQRLSTHTFSPCAVWRPLRIFPSRITHDAGTLSRNPATACPNPLPPDVAKRITALSEKS